MLIKRRRHRVPALNTASTADISFMLLIFFLVTTSMDVDKGITRQLPPVEQTEDKSVAEVRAATSCSVSSGLTASSLSMASQHATRGCAIP